ncbi:MAG: peptide ABC transporter substrate-binding protein [Porcipelethomonas sp.]
MKRKLLTFIAAAVMLSVTASGCDQQQSDGANYIFDYAMVGHPESLDPQYASDPCSLTVIGNLYTGLLEMDDKGEIKKAAAEDYTVSADGLTYNFTLRDNCFWFLDEDGDEAVSDDECFSVTAYDFEFAFRRIFNPETCSPHRGTYACLKNASSIINGSLDYTEIGVHALSDTELVFELDYPSADFLNSLTLTPAMPCNEEFFYNTKGRYGLDDQSVISDGAFFVRQWFYDPYGHDNFLYMQRNLANSDYDRIYPTSLNFYMKDDYADAENSFENGESDVIISFTCSDQMKEENNVKKYDNYTVGLIVNPESPTYSNLKLRKALAYGIDKESFEGQVSEDLSKAYGIIPPGVSAGDEKYREIVPDSLISDAAGEESLRYDPELAASYYSEGMEQMNLQSLENTKLLVPDTLMNTDYLHLVTQNWQTLFGFYIGIEEVPEDEFYNRISDGDYTLAVYPLTGSYNSPTAFIEQFVSSSNSFGFSDPKVDQIAAELNRINTYEGKSERFLEAEKLILDDFLFIPLFYKSEYEIMGSGNDDIIYNPFTKQLLFRYAKYFD